MRIGIDMLGNQTPSRTRGIGRYVRGLVSCLVARHPRHEYFLYLHPGLTGLGDSWPGNPVIRVIAPHPTGPLRDTASRLVVENPDRLDVYLVLSAMEINGSFLPPPKPLDGPKMAVVLYDLIPALYPEQYLAAHHVSLPYDWALRIVRQYDLFLTISQWTRTDCLRLLGVPPERVTTIGTASDPAFFVPDPRSGPDDAVPEPLRALGITSPFVFYVSAEDERKNHNGLVAAFGLLPARLRETHQLVITGRLPASREREIHGMARRHGIADRFVLTNFVPDEMTRLLYQRCAAFAFVSRYEGFGLPLLEAMHCGAPVVAGRNSSQVEVVGDAGLLANVDDPHDVARQLERLLVDRELAQSLRQRGPAQAARFRWETTADRTAEALETLSPTAGRGTGVSPAEEQPRRPHPRSGAMRRVKPRLAYFSPFPPQPSGIADYSANLLTELRELYLIDLYHAPYCMPRLGRQSNEFACHDYRTFPRMQRAVHYRRILYQMGNSDSHRFIYDTLFEFPGVVVLHDLFLANFHEWYALQGGAPADHFLRELTASAPASAAEYQAAPAAWRDEPGGLPAACARRGIMCNRRLLDAAPAIVVHDPWNEATIRRSHPDYHGRIHVVPHGVSVPAILPDARRATREAFGLPLDSLVIACFGILKSTKCNLEAIAAFAELAPELPSSHLLFVGRDLDGGAALAKVKSLGLSGRVHFLGHVSAGALSDLVAITDVGVNLRRPPTNGETSGTLQLLLAAGTPTIVSDVDTFSSYPERLVVKIAGGDDLAPRLAAAMRALAGDPRRRQALGRNAIDFIRETRDWRVVARQYAEVIEQASQAAVGATAA
ncbi:MAG TPA: glycosyltransferase [Pirellulales bacterium]|nr:glycosyltransferase [Pirellulales bacterium]